MLSEWKFPLISIKETTYACQTVELRVSLEYEGDKILFNPVSLLSSQWWLVNPSGQTQRYPLSVKPDWQIPLFWHGIFPQAFCKTGRKKQRQNL